MPYRYEDLGDDAFERLCGALLVHLETSTQVMPPGQSDGGYDAFIRVPGERTRAVGYQVKWTGHPDRITNPVSWILAKLDGEKPKLRQMGKSGTKN